MWKPQKSVSRMETAEEQWVLAWPIGAGDARSGAGRTRDRIVRPLNSR